MKAHRIPFAILFIVSSGAGQRAAEGFKAAAAWEKIQDLAGDWEAPLENGKGIKVNYKLRSSSILVVTFRTPSGKGTLCVYHRDGDRLLFTLSGGNGAEATS